MAGLTTTNVHIDSPLTNFVLSYTPTGFIVQDIFPVVSVNKQSDKYYTYSKDDFFRLPEQTLRAPKTLGNGIEYGVASNSYFCDEHSLFQELPYEVIANADAALAPQRAASFFLWTKHMLAWENRVASTLTSGSNVGSYTTLSGSNQWSDPSSDPRGDVAAGIDSVLLGTGYKPNTIILGYQAYSTLVRHPQMLESLKYVQKGIVTRDNLAAIFDVDRILVGASVYNSSAEGITGSYSPMWSDSVVIAHISNAPTAFGADPSLGVSFRWNAFSRGTQKIPFAVERWRDDRVKTETVRVSYHQSEKITASDLGYLILDTVA